jgi:hypothetical protein
MLAIFALVGVAAMAATFALSIDPIAEFEAHEKQLKAAALADYRKLVKDVKAGKKLKPEDIGRVLSAAGLSPADLRADVKKEEHRDRLRLVVADGAKAQSARDGTVAKIKAADDKLAVAQAEHDATVEPEYARLASIDAKVNAGDAAKRELISTDDSPHVAVKQADLLSQSTSLDLNRRELVAKKDRVERMLPKTISTTEVDGWGRPVTKETEDQDFTKNQAAELAKIDAEIRANHEAAAEISSRIASLDDDRIRS